MSASQQARNRELCERVASLEAKLEAANARAESEKRSATRLLSEWSALKVEEDELKAALLEAIEEWENNAAYNGYLAFKHDDYGRAAKMRKKFGLLEQGPIPEDIKAYYDNEKLLDIVRAEPNQEPK